MTAQPNWRTLLPYLASFILAAILASLTASPHLYFGDSAEFAIYAHQFGIAHPPGYAWFTLLLRMVGLILPVSAACAANLLGAWFVALNVPALAVFVSLIRRHNSIREKWCINGLALLSVSTPQVVFHAVGVEVYGAASALALFALAFAFRNADSAKLNRELILVGLLTGLAFAHHLVVAGATFVAVLALLLFKPVNPFKTRLLVTLNLFPWMLLGWTPALTLLFRSKANPAMNWGDPSSLAAFWNHIRGAQYSSVVGADSGGMVPRFAQLLGETLLSPGGFLAILGLLALIWVLIKKRNIDAVGSLAFTAVIAFWVLVYRIPDADSYLLPVLLLLAGWFIYLLVSFPKVTLPAGAFAAVLGVGLWGFQVAQIRPHHNLPELYGKALLEVLPDKAILFTAGDLSSFPALYMRYVEGFRPDVDVYDASLRKAALYADTKSSPRESQEAIRGRLVRNGNRPVAAVTDPLASNYDLSGKAGWEPEDLVHSAYPPGNLNFKRAAFGRDFDAKLELKEALQTFGTILPRDRNVYRLAAMLFLQSEEPGDFKLAKEALARLNKGEYWNEAGIFLRRNLRRDQAIECYLAALESKDLGQEFRNQVRLNLSNVYKDRANGALSKSKLLEAAEQYELAFTYDPENEKVIQNLGLIYARSGMKLERSRELLRHLEKLIGSSPELTMELEALDKRIEAMKKKENEKEAE